MTTTSKFIVIEGIDRSGKSSICRQIIAELASYNPISISFPNRNTPTGRIIDEHLKKEKSLHQNVIHLLFSANRWEAQDDIAKYKNENRLIVCDRYYYSGIAYTYSKSETRGIEYLKWCMSADKGLIEADLVVFVDITPEKVAGRSGFGDEMHDDIAFLRTVYRHLKKLVVEDGGVIVDGCRTVKEIAADIIRLIKNLYD